MARNEMYEAMFEALMKCTKRGKSPDRIKLREQFDHVLAQPCFYCGIKDERPLLLGQFTPNIPLNFGGSDDLKRIIFYMIHDGSCMNIEAIEKKMFDEYQSMQ